MESAGNKVPGNVASGTRRRLIKTLATAAVVSPFAGVLDAGAQVPAVKGPPRSLKLAWSATAICTVPVPVALKYGFFKKYNLDVDFINFAGSTDQLLESIASGKADGGVGMALRWLKPLEQGFDVKITSGIHGGCMRLLAPHGTGITSLTQLKGKAIGVSDMASPSKNFFSVLLAKQGIDPTRDVEWRAYPTDLLGQALKKGEVHAVADNDPAIWLVRKNYDLVEIASNLSGDYANRSCCVLAVSGNLVRKDRATAAALTQALQEAAEWTANHPDEAAAVFASYSPKIPNDDLSAMLRSHTHHHHPANQSLEQELQAYTDDLKLIHVIKPSTNSQKFAEAIYADVLG